MRGAVLPLFQYVFMAEIRLLGVVLSSRTGTFVPLPLSGPSGLKGVCGQVVWVLAALSRKDMSS
jgi:hypothetical protein